MMYSEFLNLSGQDISFEQYSEVIEPMYMATDMTKAEFVKFMLPSVKAMAKQNIEAKQAAEIANQRAVFVGTGNTTPNGCYYLGEWKKEVKREADIRTGKLKVTLRDITDEELAAIHWDSYLSYDLHYRKFGNEYYDEYGYPVIMKMV